MQTYDNHTAMFLPLLNWARENGIGVTALLQDTGLDAGSFQDKSARMNTVQRFQMLQNLIRLSPEPALGLVTGSRAKLQELGALGLTMLVAPSVSSALEVGARYSPTSGIAGYLETETATNGTFVQLHLPVLSPSLERYIAEDCFATITHYLAALTGKTRSLIAEAHFRYPAPSCHALYRQALGTKAVYFSAEHTKLLVPSSILALKPPLANDFAFQQNLELCQRFLGELRGDSKLLQNCRSLLARHIAEFTTVGRLAEALGMNTRALQRALKLLDTSFSALLADTRNALALELLRNPALTVADVAQSLGYSDTPNFRRAFRQWNKGMSPRDFRRSLQTPGP